MVRYQVEGADQTRARLLGAGDTFFSLPVVTSVPGSPLLYVESDDEPRLLAYLQQLQAARHILQFRPEKTDYGVRWLPDPPNGTFGVTATGSMGDTLGLLLEDVDAIVDAVHGGEGVWLYGYDTGCDATHPDLIGVTGDVEDEHGHGTFTMSQMRGLLPRAHCVAVRVLEGPEGRGTETGIIQKLLASREQWISQGQPLAVGNNSWGGGASRGIDDAFLYVHNSGLWMTNAQGNEGASAHTPATPTRVAQFVAAAMDRACQVASFSSGLDTWTLTTAFYSGCDEWGAKPGGGYWQKSGTSMADPWLTASLAIMRLAHPDWSVDEARSYIYTHAQPMAAPTQNGRGAGMLGLDLVGLVALPDTAIADADADADTDTALVPGVPLDDVILNLDTASALYDSIASVTTNQRAHALLHSAQPYRDQARQLAWQLRHSVPPPRSAHRSRRPPGVYPLQFAEGPRNVCRVIIPPNAAGGVDILWAGGAWRDDALPLVNTFWQPSRVPQNSHEELALFTPEDVQAFYTDAHRILVLGSYPLGNIAAAMQSQRALTAFVADQCPGWGGDPAQIVLSGHSAGGHGAVVAALWADGPPIKAIVGMASACLCIDAHWADTHLGQIIRPAWGDPQQWGAYSPHNMLQARATPPPCYLVHGKRDEQVPIEMTRRFVNLAQSRGHRVSLYEVNGGHAEPGSTRTPETAAALHAAWSG